MWKWRSYAEKGIRRPRESLGVLCPFTASPSSRYTQSSLTQPNPSDGPKTSSKFLWAGQQRMSFFDCQWWIHVCSFNMIATRISSNEENLIYPFVLDGDAIDFPIVLSHTHKSVLSEEHEARSNLSWRKLGHIVVGERWGRCKQRRRSRGFFKAPLSEQIVSVILIGEHILVGRGLPKEQWLFSNLPMLVVPSRDSQPHF